MNRVTLPGLKALGALLAYPDAPLQQALPEIRELIEADRHLAGRDRFPLLQLVDTLACSDLLDAQETYVALFDRGRATSLNLYEHIHGDSRDRGQAMVDLVTIYQRGGLQLTTRELPDHVPVLLEYLSTRPLVEVREMLDCAHLLRRIGDALVKRDSRYAAVLNALLVMAGEDRLNPARSAAADDDEKSVDEEWVEAPVLFGLGCGDARDASAATKPLRFVRKAV